MASRRSRRPPPPSPATSGQRQKFVPSPDPDKETEIPCPICRKGTVPVSVAIAVREAMARTSDGPDDETLASVPPKAVEK
jgi:hypothetical protein